MRHSDKKARTEAPGRGRVALERHAGWRVIMERGADGATRPNRKPVPGFRLTVGA